VLAPDLPGVVELQVDSEDLLQPGPREDLALSSDDDLPLGDQVDALLSAVDDLERRGRAVDREQAIPRFVLRPSSGRRLRASRRYQLIQQTYGSHLPHVRWGLSPSMQFRRAIAMGCSIITSIGIVGFPLARFRMRP